MSSTDHISFTTIVHPDAKADFDSIAPTRKEVKKNLARDEGAHRCATCGSAGNDGLKVCAGCKFNRYCSREVSDWPNHKRACKTQRQSDTEEDEENKHPELAMKLVQRVPSIDYLMHLFQLYALLSMDILDNPSNASTSMLQVTVATTPADTMGYLKAMMSGQDTSKSQIMLHITKLEVVPLSLIPAMQRLLEEVQGNQPSDIVMPIMFTNKMNAFFHPVVILPPALEDARNKPPIQVKSNISDITELPLNETNLRDTMNSFIRMDKKNQLKLRAIPK